MASEPLEYKVTFDTSEVAQKLQEVKNQMDVAFGAQAFQTSGPDPFPMQQLFDVPKQAFSQLKEGFGEVQSQFSNAKDIMNTVAESSRLGYSKFREDMELDGLIASQASKMTRERQLGFEDAKIDASSRKYFGSQWQSTTGTGYDPSMALSRSEYMEIAEDDSKKEFRKPSKLGMGLSALGLLTAGGPIGLGIAGTGALFETAKAISYPLTANMRREENIASYVGDTSWRFLSGQINKKDSKDVAKYVSEIAQSDDMAGQSYTNAEVDQTIDTYTKAGGYDLVRTAEQYKETTKKLFEDHRKVMHTLHASSKEATELMASLSKDLGVTDFSGWASNMKVLGKETGLSGRELTSFAMQGAEMARGSGFGMKEASMGAANLLAEVRYLAKEGVYTDEMLRQGGGAENIALQATRSAMNFGGSPMGMINNAALMSSTLGGSESPLKDTANMGMDEKLYRAANLYSSPGQILKSMGMQDSLNTLKGPQLLGLEETQGFIQQYGKYFGEKNVDPMQFKGFLLASGLSKTETDRVFATWAGDPERFDKRNAKIKEQLVEDIYKDKTSLFEKFSGKVSRILDKGYRNLEEEVGEPISYGLSRVEDTLDAAYDFTLGRIFNVDSELTMWQKDQFNEDGGSFTYDSMASANKLKTFVGDDFTLEEARNITNSENFDVSLLDKDKINLLTTSLKDKPEELEKNLLINKQNLVGTENLINAQAYIEGIGLEEFYDTDLKDNEMLKARKKLSKEEWFKNAESLEDFENEYYKKGGIEEVQAIIKQTNFGEVLDTEERQMNASIGHLWHLTNMDLARTAEIPEERQKYEDRAKQVSKEKTVIDIKEIKARKDEYMAASQVGNKETATYNDDFWIKDRILPEKIDDAVELRYAQLSDRDREYFDQREARAVGQSLSSEYLTGENIKTQDAFVAGVNAGGDENLYKATGAFRKATKGLTQLSDLVDLNNKEVSEFFEGDLGKEVLKNVPKNIIGDQNRRVFATGQLAQATRGSEGSFITEYDGISGAVVTLGKIGDLARDRVKGNDIGEIFDSAKEVTKKARADTWKTINDKRGGMGGFLDTDTSDYIDDISIGSGYSREEVTESIAVSQARAREKVYKIEGLTPGQRTEQVKEATIVELAKSSPFVGAFEGGDRIAEAEKLVSSFGKVEQEAFNILEDKIVDIKDQSYAARVGVQKKKNIDAGMSDIKAQANAEIYVQGNKDLASSEELREIEKNEVASEYIEALDKSRGSRLAKFKKENTRETEDALGNKTTVFDENTVMSVIATSLQELVSIMKEEYTKK